MDNLLRYESFALLGLVGALLLLPACSGGSCNANAASGVVVFVVDATTGQDVCSATVTITDGAYAETLQSRPSDNGHTCEYDGASERPGTYTVSGAAAGYQPTQQDNVVARAGACHVETATVTIALAR
jgi:hypothetical protein